MSNCLSSIVLGFECLVNVFIDEEGDYCPRKDSDKRSHKTGIRSYQIEIPFVKGCKAFGMVCFAHDVSSGSVSGTRIVGLQTRSDDLVGIGDD
jgi:hypothetical protein